MYQTAKVDTQSAYLGTNRADSIKTIGLMSNERDPFPPEYNTGINVELNMPDWGTENRTHSHLWRIHHTIAEIAPTATHLERISHHAYPPWHQHLDPRRITTHISRQKKEAEAETHTSLVNSL